MKLTLIRKLLIGFSVMVLLIMITGTYVIWTLRELRTIHESVLVENLPAIEATHRLTESLLAQDLYEKRYDILRDPATADLFLRRGEEFQLTLDELNFNQQGSDPPIRDSISELHLEYQALFKEKQSVLESGQESPAGERVRARMDKKFEGLISLLRDTEQRIRLDQNRKFLSANETSQEAFGVTAALVTVSILFGIGFTVYINSNLSYSLRKMQEAVQNIGRGNYDQALNIKATDEVGELADSVRRMSKRLKALGELNLDANPLTRLPGNLAIEKYLLTRLQTGAPFAFCLVDLDNFKAFGDRYGYSRGSEVLKVVGDLIMKTVQTLGDEKDFVGHIGGDDFVIISHPHRVDKICGTLISEFDETIPSYYSKGDRNRGYIISKDRKDVKQNFPIMTISIAVVTNQNRIITEPGQVAEISAKLKKYAKTFPRSIYVVDQRRTG